MVANVLSRQPMAKCISLSVGSSRIMRDLITLMARMTISPSVLGRLDWLKRRMFCHNGGLLNRLILVWIEILMDYFTLVVSFIFRIYWSILDFVVKFSMKHMLLDVLYIPTM